MTVTLGHGTSRRDITDLLVSWTWSGDAASVCRQPTGEMVCEEDSGLPLPALGDRVAMEEAGERLFEGVVLLRSLGSEDKTLSFTAYDYGFYLQRNDGTFRFTGAPPEEITRLVCASREVPVAALPATGVPIRRKFAGVGLSEIIRTAWSLAGERNGKVYAIRYTPAGLLVKERREDGAGLVLRGGSNLMDAATREDASRMVNSAAIYDRSGNLIRRTGDTESQRLYGVMERHIPSGEDAEARARRVLEEGRLQRTVTVNVLGDTSLLTGETVVVREERTGLSGVFWIDADVHTWKRRQYYSRLTLNCRNVMGFAGAGSEDL